MAGVTVKEILTLAPLARAVVLGGEAGLSRVVTGVNVMEVPDIEGFVKPGEILLTTGFPVHEHPERLVELVPELARRGLAALAVKPLRYLARIPEDLGRVADEAGLPFIVVPDDTSFNEVIGAVLAVVLADYGPEPTSADAIRERLTGVALSGGGLDGIAAALTAALDRTVTILDPDGYVIGGSPREATSGQDVDPAKEPRASFPVSVGGVERGTVVVAGTGELTLGQRRLVRQSCFAAAMHIAQALASLELDRKLRTLFLEELVTGGVADEQAIRQRSRLFGWDLSGAHRVLVARCQSELADASIATAAASALPAGSLAWSRGTEVIAIVAEAQAGRGTGQRAVRKHRDRPLERIWCDTLVRLAPGGVVVAVGSVARSTLEFVDSHASAREAIEIARRTGRETARYDDLMLERLLLANPPELLREFTDRRIGVLADHDARTGADLCRTLEAYLGHGSGAQAARALFVHYNTMKHRLRRITELTGADLHDPRTRLTLALALETRRLAGPVAARPTAHGGRHEAD